MKAQNTLISTSNAFKSSMITFGFTTYSNQIEGMHMEEGNALDFLKRLTDGISAMFGNQCEVVVWDLSTPKAMIIYKSDQQVTTNERKALGEEEKSVLFEGKDVINGKGITKNKQLIKTSTFHLKADHYHYVIVINYDYTYLSLVESILNDFTQFGESRSSDIEQDNSVNHMLEELYEEAIAYIGKPVPIMNREERVQMVCYLNERGAFSIHKGIPIISEKMNLSRYTIYNYLKEHRGVKK